MSSKVSKKANIVKVDVSAVKKFWFSLDAAERLRVIYFDDPRLVQRVTQIQADLSSSDLMCFKLGIGGQDSLRTEVGMDQFSLECDANLSPVAFFAKPVFAQRSDLFDFIEQRLGRSFLKGRQALLRPDWCSVLQGNANSWRGFMAQVLELVELAILQAHNDAKSFQERRLDEDTRQAEEAAENIAAELLAEPEPVAKKSSSSKKKAKRKCIFAAQKAAMAELADSGEDVAAEPLQEDSSEETAPEVVDKADSLLALGGSASSWKGTDQEGSPPPLDESMCEAPEAGLTFDWSRPPLSLEALKTMKKQHFSDVDSVRNYVDEVASTTEAPSSDYGGATGPEGEIVLSFDWNPTGPPIDETTEGAAVELEVDWSNNESFAMETRWSAWLGNGLTGSAAEWHWVTTGPPTIAYLKNTFVEAAAVVTAEERVRPQSVPARVKPREL